MGNSEEQIYDYVDSFTSPAESDFLGDKQRKSLTDMDAKLSRTASYFKTMADHPEWSGKIDQAIAKGEVYSAGEADNAYAKLKALNWSGTRLDIGESLVTPTGQRVIMSSRLQSILGLDMDSVMMAQDTDRLVSALKADSVPGPEIDKVMSAMKKYGAILLQRGMYVALKDLVEEVTGRQFAFTSSRLSRPAPAQPTPAAAPSPAPKPLAPGQLAELPFSFIEYLKNTDKEFDRVEHEVMSDPSFQEFFNALKKQYAYYKTLPADRMAGETMVRPQLWVKLSPQTRVWVQNIVERNREEFATKIKQVGESAQVDKLEQLKKDINQ